MWPRPISQPHCREDKTRWEGELKSTEKLHPTAADRGKLVPIEKNKIPMGLSPKSSAEGHRGAMTEGNFSRLDWELLELNQSLVDSSPALDPDAQDSPFLYTIPAVYGLITLIGLVGNVTLIKIFCTVKSMRNVPNIFITSLALGDLLLLLTCAPVDASKYVATEWIFGRVGCKLIPFIQLTSVGVSVFTLTALSADRYKAIVRPMDIQTTNALMKICVKAALIWVFSMLLAVPDAVFSDLQSFYDSHSNKTFTTCAPYPLGDELHPKIHSTASFLILYVIPLFIISVYYFHIAKNLIRSAYNIPAEGNQHILRQMESRKRLAKTVLVFVGFFAVSWLPSHIIYLYRSYHYRQVDTSLAHLVGSICARILAFSNSCVNPFALYLLSKTFRKQFNNNLFCCRSHLLLRSTSTGRSTTASRMTSLKSTNHSVASFSLINGNFVQQEGYV